MKKVSRLFISIILLLGIVCLSACGVAADIGYYGAEAEVNRYGKSNVTFTFSKEKVSKEYGIESSDEFDKKFRDFADLIHSVSSGYVLSNETIVVNDVTESETAYSVNVKTCRIDKINGLGEIVYGTGSSFYKNNQDSAKRLFGYYYGNYSETFTSYGLDGNKKIVEFAPDFEPFDENASLTVSAVGKKDGKIVGEKEFTDYLSGTDDKIIAIKLIDLKLVEKITLTVDGKINFYSSRGVKVIGDNKVEIAPVNYAVKKTVVYDDDSLTPDIVDKADCDCVFAYIVYSENVSPIVWILAGIAVLLPAVLIFLTIKFRWISKFGKSKFFARVKKHRLAYLMLLPGLALLILFHYYPLTYLTSAFQDYRIAEGFASEFIGLRYFRSILYAVYDNYTMIKNTIFISVIRIGTNFPIILLYALLINTIKNNRLKGWVQAVSYIPFFLSWTAVGGMGYALMGQYGLINKVLLRIGLPAVDFYSRADLWWGILALSSLWKGMGWSSLIYVAAMCNIDNELYEACALDGGGRFRMMITVTIPSIMNIICLQLILDTGAVMRDNYEQILSMLYGANGVSSTTKVIGEYIYSAALNPGSSNGLGAASAMGLIQGVIGLILVLITNRVVKKTGNEGIL